MVSPEYKAALQRLATIVPTVVLGCPIPGVECRFIQREQRQGVLMAVSYLVSLGHKYISYVGGEGKWVSQRLVWPHMWVLWVPLVCHMTSSASASLITMRQTAIRPCAPCWQEAYPVLLSWL